MIWKIETMECVICKNGVTQDGLATVVKMDNVA